MANRFCVIQAGLGVYKFCLKNLEHFNSSSKRAPFSFIFPNADGRVGLENFLLLAALILRLVQDSFLLGRYAGRRRV